jgi:hypothetical protein
MPARVTAKWKIAQRGVSHCVSPGPGALSEETLEIGARGRGDRASLFLRRFRGGATATARLPPSPSRRVSGGSADGPGRLERRRCRGAGLSFLMLIVSVTDNAIAQDVLRPHLHPRPPPRDAPARSRVRDRGGHPHPSDCGVGVRARSALDAPRVARDRLPESPDPGDRRTPSHVDARKDDAVRRGSLRARPFRLRAVRIARRPRTDGGILRFGAEARGARTQGPGPRIGVRRPLPGLPEGRKDRRNASWPR